MNGNQSSEFTDVLVKMYMERDRQLIKHGDQSHLPDGTGPDLVIRWPVESTGCHTLYPTACEVEAFLRRRCNAASQTSGDGSITKEMILTEEWGEVLAAESPQDLRKELIQLATVAAWWASCLPE